MADERLAQTYAQALFEQAVGNWLAPLKAVSAALTKSGLTDKLDDTGTAFSQKQELLKSALPTNTAPQVQNLVSLLVSKNQAHLLPQVVAEFERYAQRTPASAIAHVTSAVALTDAEKQTLETKLRVQFGKETVFDYSVDANVLGGVIVRVGDKVIDASVAGKLAALKEKLK
ncbi:MAG: F0F1 ATP synthase subunit delta [Chloroflexi bacterium]|nr:F0F1 ATP synthase subunit delta [Chloroflexota bacterium]